MHDSVIPRIAHVEYAGYADLPKLNTFQIPSISSVKSFSIGKFSTFLFSLESLDFIIGNDKTLFIFEKISAKYQSLNNYIVCLHSLSFSSKNGVPQQWGGRVAGGSS